MFSKRASMQMSISTIVLLILALALMTIVIGSFTGLFSSSEDKLMKSISLMDASAKATSSDIIAGGNAFKLQRNRDVVLLASFYNSGHSECAQSAHIIFNCGSSIITYSRYIPVVISVPIGKEKTLGVLVNVNPSTPRGDYVCNLKVRCGPDEDPDEIVAAEQHSILKIT